MAIAEHSWDALRPQKIRREMGLSRETMGYIMTFVYAGRATDNRWNVKGQPTLFLAGDVGVALIVTQYTMTMVTHHSKEERP